MAEGEYFSVLAFFIVFREALEAAIVCAVLLGVLQHSGQQNLKKWVWIGLGLGLLLTLMIMIAVVVAFTAASASFSFKANKITQGVLGVTAAVLIGYVALTLGDLIDKKEKIEKAVKHAVEEAEQVDMEADLTEEEKEQIMYEHMRTLPQDETWKTIFFLSFTAVVREGFETIVFLGVGSGFSGKALPLPILVGGASGAVCGYFMYKSSGQVALRRFLNISIVFLLFVGAGIFTHGIFEFQEIKNWGSWETVVYNLTPVCCSLSEPGWAIFRGVFGFTPYPTRAEMLSYFAYWFVMIVLFLIKWHIRRKQKEASVDVDGDAEPEKDSSIESTQSSPASSHVDDLVLA
mmetsp:Transcript_11114/g.12723  ORF Transcript_11114/g.12723 Transcript_11114/m.12723 type:complete len:347 (+) Transcript_11114:127-1167(+)